MTDDEILIYAKTMTKAMIVEFARVIAAKEREACAAIVDAEMDEWDGGNVNVALNNVAAEIRARGMK